jgi:alkylated DNA repair dioxygenase AlkB
MAMRGTVERPNGLVYQPELLTPEEESHLAARFGAMEFDPVVLRGQAARRVVRHFGYGYDIDSWAVQQTEPIPHYLVDLRARCGELAATPPEEFREALITRYPPGAGIGWHRDAAAFGPAVVGISLGGEAVMRFQRIAAGGERRVFEQPLEPRSAYVLAGAARLAWQHSVPAVAELRYSITFRTVKAARPEVAHPQPSSPS